MSEIIYISEDGVKREATLEELQQFRLDKETKNELKVEHDAKLSARQSALPKLSALGLT